MRSGGGSGGLGRRGERAAEKLLRSGGYRLLARNLRSRFGEVDLLAEDPRDRCVVIVEVKATRSQDPPPEAHVDARKRHKLSALAGQIVRRYRLEDRVVRFDVVAIVWPEGEREPDRITHHVNAFESTL